MKKTKKPVITNREDREKKTLPAGLRIPPDFRSEILLFLEELKQERKGK